MNYDYPPHIRHSIQPYPLSIHPSPIPMEPSLKSLSIYVKFQLDSNLYLARVNELDGCVAYGETLPEAIFNLAHVTKEYLSANKEIIETRLDNL